jgi:hypothetical protein
MGRLTDGQHAPIVAPQNHRLAACYGPWPASS